MIKKVENELINHHIHSTGSHGEVTPRNLVLEAIKKGFSYICFTDHNPRPYGSPWGESFFPKGYIEEIKELQEEFNDKLEIGLGIEIDWTEEHQDVFTKQINQTDFDYVLGSVHLLKLGGKYFGTNFDKESMARIFKEYGEEVVLKEYFNQVRLLAKSGLFDTVAHFDLIKNANKDNSMFDINSDFYKKEVLKTLDVIKETGLCLEINTSGEVYDCGEFFPSFWVLEEANKRGIPLTIGADTHELERFDTGLEEARKLAKKAGYKEILKFKNRKPAKVKL